MGFFAFTYQDICAEHKKILISLLPEANELSQRVLDDYDKYKYYFSMVGNATAGVYGFIDSFLTLRNYTGLSKVAYLDQDVSLKDWRDSLLESLSENGFEVVYQNSATWTTTDFTSYFAAMEASGAEILFPWVFGGAGVTLVKEWCDRQSPFVIWGTVDWAQYDYFWDLTEGKCEYVSFTGVPAIAGYPLTNESVPTREAYIQRWQKPPTSAGVVAYDFVRFILPDAIKRAGTTETEALIKALETTNVETSTARHFVFTSSHGILYGLPEPGKPNMDYVLVCLFQWQNGTQVPVYPKEIMEEAKATFKYPPWQGPWTSK